jgi:hypothetical protein
LQGSSPGAWGVRLRDLEREEERDVVPLSVDIDKFSSAVGSDALGVLHGEGGEDVEMEGRVSGAIPQAGVSGRELLSRGKESLKVALGMAAEASSRFHSTPRGVHGYSTTLPQKLRDFMRASAVQNAELLRFFWKCYDECAPRKQIAFSRLAAVVPRLQKRVQALEEQQTAAVASTSLSAAVKRDVHKLFALLLLPIRKAIEAKGIRR